MGGSMGSVGRVAGRTKKGSVMLRRCCNGHEHCQGLRTEPVFGLQGPGVPLRVSGLAAAQHPVASPEVEGMSPRHLLLRQVQVMRCRWRTSGPGGHE